MQGEEKKSNSYYSFRSRNNLFILNKDKIKQSVNNKAKANNKGNRTAKVKKWINDHWANILGILINGFLAYFTYRLFNETVQQRALTEKATNAAISASNEAKRANEISEHNYQLSKDVFQSQSQNFDVENKPFIQVEVKRIGTLVANQKLTLIIALNNAGKYPVRVIKEEGGSYCADKPFPKTSNFINTTSYIINGNSSANFMFDGNTLTQGQVDSLTSGKYHIFYYGKITYINEANGKQRQYEFSTQIDYQPINLIWLKNKNIDLKN